LWVERWRQEELGWGSLAEGGRAGGFGVVRETPRWRWVAGVEALGVCGEWGRRAWGDAVTGGRVGGRQGFRGGVVGGGGAGRGGGLWVWGGGRGGGRGVGEG